MLKGLALKAINKIISEYNYLRQKPEPVVFDHIPKCAGTSIHAFLRKYYPTRFTYLAGVHKNQAGIFKQYPEKKRNRFAFISGHSANNLLDYVRKDAVAVTVFRDPVDRIVSHYYYVKRQTNHPLHERAFVRDSVSLQDYCAKFDDESLHNFYVRRYSGLEAAEIDQFPERAISLALEKIVSRYAVVGFQDRLPEFLQRVGKRLQLPGRSFRAKVRNKTASRPALSDLDELTRRQIARYNELDIRLYHLLLERFA